MTRESIFTNSEVNRLYEINWSLRYDGTIKEKEISALLHLDSGEKRALSPVANIDDAEIVAVRAVMNCDRHIKLVIEAMTESATAQYEFNEFTLSEYDHLLSAFEYTAIFNGRVLDDYLLDACCVGDEKRVDFILANGYLEPPVDTAELNLLYTDGIIPIRYQYMNSDIEVIDEIVHRTNIVDEINKLLGEDKSIDNIAAIEALLNRTIEIRAFVEPDSKVTACLRFSPSFMAEPTGDEIVDEITDYNINLTAKERSQVLHDAREFVKSFNAKVVEFQKTWEDFITPLEERKKDFIERD